MTRSALAHLGDRWASELIEVTDDLRALDTTGRWAVAIPYEGPPVCARFARWDDQPPVGSFGRWAGVSLEAWSCPTGAADYTAMVESVRDAIAQGMVYQANVCRVLSAACDGPDDDVAALWLRLRSGNPSPHGGFLRLPAEGIGIASASPELYLSVTAGPEGRTVTSAPIKGTGRTEGDLTDKDVAENIMIVDLVRNDLARITEPGTVNVPHLLQVQEHPGLVHLVSYVSGTLVAGATWPQIIDATFPPGSVTGAPKGSALRIIDSLEPSPRDFYCGAFGWVDADTGEAELAVSIRTFWLRDGILRFGTGAGITWGSDSAAEWAETELKAERLIGLAAGPWQADGP